MVTLGGPIGNEEFEKLYQEYGKRVYAYFLGRMGSVHDAEDLAAGVFEKVLDRYDSFDAAKGTFEVWLFRLAKNMAADSYRVHQKKTSRTEGLDAAAAIPGGTSPEETALTHERNGMLTEAIGQLPPRKRDMITLRYLAGLKNAEIAAVYGLSAGNVGVMIHRALKKLEKTLTKKGMDLS